jgi:hypothetical protein
MFYSVVKKYSLRASVKNSKYLQKMAIDIQKFGFQATLLTFRLLLVFLLFGVELSAQKSVFKKDHSNLTLKVGTDTTGKSALANNVIFASSGKVSIQKVKSKVCLGLSSNKEFSDAFYDLKKLVGSEIDFTQAKYLWFDLYVPKPSSMAAIKFNFKDEEGNFGGSAEMANGFATNKDKWLKVLVNMDKLRESFTLWHGSQNPLQKVRYFSVNPYNYNLEDSSVVYFNNINFGMVKPSDYTEFTAPILGLKSFPFKMDFEDTPTMQSLLAYRKFEGSNQLFAQNIAGNVTTALRIKGSETKKNLAFLPNIYKMCQGQTINFTNAKRIKFKYYLTPESEDFDGTWLFLTSKDWKDILIARNFKADFVKGSWQDATVEIDDLIFDAARGKPDFLETVYELRFNINYTPGHHKIEMWLDDFIIE